MDAGVPRVIVAGAPASGKGTLCELLKERYSGMLHLSTGDMLREAVAEGSAVGLQAQSFIDNGRLVPDELFVDDLTERLQSPEAQQKGWLLDGFPLTWQQANALTDAGVQKPDVFLLVEVPEEELQLRLSGRRVDPVTGKTYHLKYAPPEDPEVAARLVRRQDDSSERAATRLATFRRHTGSIVAHYSPQLVRLDGSQPKQAVFAAAATAIDAAVAARTRLARSRAATAASPAAAAMAAAAAATGAGAGAVRLATPPVSSSSETAAAGAVAAAARRRKPAAAAAVAADALRAVLSLAAFVAADAALARAFRLAAIGFPSSLAGMVAIFAALLLLEGARPDAAAAAVAAMLPGAALLSRWMPVFFVPSLVALPLAPPVAGGDAARISVIVVAGYVASLLSTAAMVKLLPGGGGGGGGSGSGGSSGGSGGKSGKALAAAAAAKPKPRPAPKAFPRRLARSLATLAAVAGAAAVAATTSFSAAFPFSLPAQQLRTSYLLLATLHGYVLGTRLPPALTRVVHPVVVCAILTLGAAAAFAKATAAPLAAVLAAYMAKPAAGSGLAGVAAGAGGGALLLSLLGPSILSFAVQMFERRRLMWRNLAAVAAVPVAAAGVGLFGTAAAARALALPPPLRLATLPRSITSPLAIAITGMLAPAVGGGGGSLASLAVALVVVSGVLGANAGARLLDWAGVRDPVARGLAQGASSHGLGTAAMANEPEAFAFSAVSMALTATASTVLVSIPAIRRLLLQVALGGG